MALPPTTIYRIIKLFIKLPVLFLIEIKKNLQLHVKTQKSQDSPNDFDSKRSARGTTIPDSKLCYRAIVIRTAWHWRKSDPAVMGIGDAGHGIRIEDCIN